MTAEWELKPSSPDLQTAVIQQMFTKYLFVQGTGWGSRGRAVNKTDAVPALILVEETDNKWQSQYM